MKKFAAIFFLLAFLALTLESCYNASTSWQPGSHHVKHTKYKKTKRR